MLAVLILQFKNSFSETYDTIASIYILVVKFLYNLDDVSLINFTAILIKQASELADSF